MLRALRHKGLQAVEALKATGTSSLTEILRYQDFGAAHVFDCVDFGLPTTYPSGRTDIHVVFNRALDVVLSIASDAVLIECGGDILGGNVPAFLNCLKRRRDRAQDYSRCGRCARCARGQAGASGDGAIDQPDYRPVYRHADATGANAGAMRNPCTQSGRGAAGTYLTAFEFIRSGAQLNLAHANVIIVRHQSPIRNRLAVSELRQITRVAIRRHCHQI